MKYDNIFKVFRENFVKLFVVGDNCFVLEVLFYRFRVEEGVVFYIFDSNSIGKFWIMFWNFLKERVFFKFLEVRLILEYSEIFFFVKDLEGIKGGKVVWFF